KAYWKIGLRPVRRAGLNPGASRNAHNLSAGHTGKMPMFRRKACVALCNIMVLLAALSVHAQGNPEAVPRAMPVAGGPNDVARFLAGMPVPVNSPLAPLTHNPAWQEHAAFFEKEFSKLTLRQLQKLHAWQETYFPESLQSIPVAFYMFSGPDFLYVDQF